MKAEQRKELETNALADRMGHLVRRVKTQPRKATLYYVIGAVAAVLILFIAYNWYRNTRDENAQFWMAFNSGNPKTIVGLADGAEAKGTPQSKAARFQFAWWLLWDKGIKHLGQNGAVAMESLQSAGAQYQLLAAECKEDPVWEPEALYALAVIQETFALQKSEQLDVAKKQYQELATKYPNSAYGKLAEEWVKNYDDPKKKQELFDFYQEMRVSPFIRIPEPEAPKTSKSGDRQFPKSKPK